MIIKIRSLVALIIVLLAVFAGIIYWNFRGDQSPFFALFEKPVHYDLLIKNADIADGSGAKLIQGDIAVAGERIARVGRFRATADQVIDAKGLIVAPGFINPHSHIDQSILNDPAAQASLLQGVTTEIVGLDGLSVLDFDKHFAQVSQQEIGINYGSLVGQGSIRQAVMGTGSLPATLAQISSMQTLVEKAMEQGAFGLSTGLEYVPGIYTPTEEIIQLAKAVAPYKGVYVSHIRNERDTVVGAVKEALEIAESAGIPAVISHIKVGSSIYNASREEVITRSTGEVIKAIAEYRKAGGKVYADIYPYRVSFFQINKRPEQVLWRFPDSLIFVSSSSNKSYTGKTITDIAAARGVEPSIIAQQLIADPRARVCTNTLSEASLRRLIRSDFTMIGMDNVLYWGDPSYIPPAHPRNYGTYPKVLGEYVRENRVLTLEKAVYKMTGMTAEAYRIPERGLIREGFFADLVVFDPQTVRDRATYEKPSLPPQGISYVIVNGKIAVSKGEKVGKATPDSNLTGILAGKIIKPRKIFP